jgi:hypothetical protein
MVEFLKKIFRALDKAISWLAGGEDERLRAARTRGQKVDDAKGLEPEKNEEADDNRSEVERYYEEFNVWDEIDSYRTTFWFGSRVGRLLSKSRRRGEQLEKELEELDRKKEEEKRKRGEG